MDIKKNFIEELRWRGMLHDMTAGVEELLNTKMTTGYIGFDPTAPSLTIGNYVQIMLLSHFQQSGHRPIFLLGGATGRIGDPSGKDKERELKGLEELDRNLSFQSKQAAKFLNFESGPNAALMLNNYDFYANMNVLDFLRNVGKNLTVNYMLSKEAVKRRLDTGLSYTEFSYQLLQAYDFLHLYRTHGCVLQMGGSDQWGNITSGTEFIRRNIPDAHAYALTSPLLTKSDGKKFGKSEKGNIWLDPKMTSPYKFYQFWINADDADLDKFFKYFSFKGREEQADIFEEYAEDPRKLKQILAEDMTIRIHSIEDFKSVQDVSQILFGKATTLDQLRELPMRSFVAIGEEIPFFKISREFINAKVDINDLMTRHAEICKSKSEVRRAIMNNAIAINGTKITDPEHKVSSFDLIKDHYLLVENGKKNKYLIEVY